MRSARYPLADHASENIPIGFPIFTWAYVYLL